MKRIAVGSPADSADHFLTDSAGTLGQVHGIAGEALLLVRPDGYIGHIATQDFLTGTRTAIEAMTPPARSRIVSESSAGTGVAE